MKAVDWHNGIKIAIKKVSNSSKVYWFVTQIVEAIFTGNSFPVDILFVWVYVNFIVVLRIQA